MTVTTQTIGATNSQKNGFVNVHPDRLSWPGGQGSIGNVNGIRKMEPRYPHIKDLQAKANAVIRELPIFIPVC